MFQVEVRRLGMEQHPSDFIMTRGRFFWNAFIIIYPTLNQELAPHILTSQERQEKAVKSKVGKRK